MEALYPAVFKGPTRAEAVSTVSHRVIVSMFSFLRELERRASASLPEQNDRLVKTVLWGRDYDVDYDALLRGIKARDVRDLARKFLAGDHIVEIYTEE